MSSPNSNKWIPIVVAIITVLGTIIVALISRSGLDIQSKEQKKFSTDTIIPKKESELRSPIIEDPFAPRFNDLSTFCDTISYLISQNKVGYNWLKQDLITINNGTNSFSAKLRLLNFPLVVEKDDVGLLAYILFIRTSDVNEAERMYKKIIDRFRPCLDSYVLKKFKEKYNDISRYTYEFRYDGTVITINHNTLESGWHTVEAYIEPEKTYDLD